MSENILDSQAFSRYSSSLRKGSVMQSVVKAFVVSAAVVLAGCSDNTKIFSSTPAAGAQQSGKAAAAGYYKIGNPYQISGVWYYPKEDYSYNETGVASWYGEDFHNGITANGELYDMHSLTAAHRTLPLPSIVRVTNLQNGRSLVLRVNDRGPFVDDRVRIIDVSMRAAQLLGFKEQGTTQVRVEVLPKESKELKEQMLAAASGDKEAETAAFAGTEGNPENIVAVNHPDAPKNLAANSYPRLANTPPPSFESDDVLISDSATAKKSSDNYNSWDEDLTPAQSRKEVVAEPPKETAKKMPAKGKAAPVQKPAPQKKSSAKKPVQGPVYSEPLAAGYYVQIGAFGSRDNAERMRLKASQYGKALVIPVTVNGKPLYRVRLGPANAKKALDMMDKLTNAGFTDARLIEEK